MAVKKGIVVDPRVMGFVNLCKGIGTLYKVGNSYLARLGEISSNIKKTLWESIDVILAVEAATESACLTLSISQVPVQTDSVARRVLCRIPFFTVRLYWAR